MTIQKNRALCLASLLLTLTLFAGCTKDPIFSAIEEEVKLKDPTMTGTVTSFEVVNHDLYATNGYIYKRTNGTGSWIKLAFPSESVRCSEIASDGTWLYARFVEVSDWTNFDSVQRYDTSTGVWTPVSGLSGIVRIGSGSGRIYAFTKNGDDNYNAYVSSSTTTFDSTPVGTSITTPTSTSGNFVSTNAKVYYYNGSSLAEAGTSPTGVTGITVVAKPGKSANTYLYAVTLGYAWRYDGTTATGNWTNSGHSVATPTTNIAYLRSKNLLLIASGANGGGYGEIKLDDTGAFSSNLGAPGGSTESSVAPANKDQYDSSVGLRALYRIDVVDAKDADGNATGSVPAGNDYVLYASVMHYSYGGIWSYYPGTIPEWNRE